MLEASGDVYKAEELESDWKSAEAVVGADEPDCVALALTASVDEGIEVDSELVDTSEVVLPVPEVDEATSLEPDTTLLPEETAEEG